MSKTLIITEKPSVARDVTAALPEAFKKQGDFYESEHWVVGSAVGHLVEQVDPDSYDARYKKWRFEDLPILPDEFRYEARDDRARKQLAALHAAIRRTDVEALVNACDAGREGELIFKLIAQTSGTTKPVRRAWFSSMTQRAIRDAFERLRDDGELRPLEDAGALRSRPTGSSGMNATRAATTKAGSLRSIVSLGRVQTPTLALIARRDMEIAAFVPRTTGRFGRRSPRRPPSATAASGSRGRRTGSARPSRPSGSRRPRAAWTRRSSRWSASPSRSRRRCSTTSRPCSGRRTAASGSPPSGRWPRPRAATTATRS
jgi:hypothetical protein